MQHTLVLKSANSQPGHRRCSLLCSEKSVQQSLLSTRGFHCKSTPIFNSFQPKKSSMPLLKKPLNDYFLGCMKEHRKPAAVCFKWKQNQYPFKQVFLLVVSKLWTSWDMPYS